ncbi:MAG: hypothetical protein AAGB34_05050 [Planctomycetota bacterium]
MSDPITHAARVAGWRGFAAIAAVILLLVVGVSSLAPVLGVMFGHSEKEDAQAIDSEQRLERFRTLQEGFIAQANGRSLFFVPSAPPPVKRNRPNRDEDSEKEPPPAVYAGPKLIGIVGTTAWFEDDLRLTVGGDAQDDLTLISTSAPWFATVEWRGERFEVTLFERTTDEFMDSPEDLQPDDASLESEQAVQDNQQPQDAG